MSANAIQEDLRQFTTQLLEQAGGMVEWSASQERGTGLAPPAVAALLRMPDEAFSLALDRTDEGLSVSLGGEFLDLAGQVLQARVPRIGAFRIPERHLKKGDIAELLGCAYAWPNARVRLQSVSPATCEYQTWHFHAALRSEDCFETRISATLNAHSLVPLELPDLLQEFGLESTSGQAELAGLEGTREVAGKAAAQQLMVAAKSFLGRIDARLARDQKRLRDYYNALIREAGAPNRRTKTVVSPEATEAKKKAVQLELRRKLAELEERYAMRADLTTLCVVRCQLPVLAVDLDVTRKQSRRIYTVYWNSLLKSFEPLACARCGNRTFSPHFTEGAVDAICRNCWEHRGD